MRVVFGQCPRDQVPDFTIAPGIGQFAAIQSVAPLLGVEVSTVSIRDAGEIERAVAGFARSSRSGLILTESAFATVHRDLIITLSARHKLPTVYPWRIYVASGGLISYGPDFNNQHRQAAGYVDRMLKGEKPSDLPVQTPTKYSSRCGSTASRHNKSPGQPSSGLKAKCEGGNASRTWIDQHD
jgi:putative ABC transport system substrate-binding protein